MAIEKKLIDQLLTDYKKPEDITGENGLLKELTKAILERALAAEMTDLSSSDFRCGPANLWASAEHVRWVPGELFKFRPLDFGWCPNLLLGLLLGLSVVVFLTHQFKYEIFASNLKNNKFVTKLGTMDGGLVKNVPVGGPTVEKEAALPLMNSLDYIPFNSEPTGEGFALSGNIRGVIVVVPLVGVIESVWKFAAAIPIHVHHQFSGWRVSSVFDRKLELPAPMSPIAIKHSDHPQSRHFERYVCPLNRLQRLQINLVRISHFIGASLGCIRGSFLQGDAVSHSFSSFGSLSRLLPDSPKSDNPDCYQRPIGPYGCVPFWCFLLSVGCLCLSAVIVYNYDGRFSSAISLTIALLSVPIWFCGRISCEKQKCKEHAHLHNGISVTQKDLTNSYCCNTLIDMANVLNKDKQIAIIGALAEGSSIRSIERLTGVHRDTIMRLGVRVGQGCAMLHDSKMRDLPCRYLQFDEIWGFIGKKERHIRAGEDPRYGDVWTFCAIDAETKIVPSFRCGKRDTTTALAFVEDIAGRMRNRVQISSDALRSYVDAIEEVFGKDVDFGQIVKTYEHDHSQHPELKYSAPKFVAVDKRSVTGFPDMDLVSTSYIERLNATTRLHMRRLTRLTLAFSKKLENFEAAVALHFAYYNFVMRHNSLRCTPAMAAGVERDFWTVGNLLEATV